MANEPDKTLFDAGKFDAAGEWRGKGGCYLNPSHELESGCYDASMNQVVMQHLELDGIPQPIP